MVQLGRADNMQFGIRLQRQARPAQEGPDCQEADGYNYKNAEINSA
jgi:hypothetical protein